jgi:hypothetical protein
MRRFNLLLPTPAQSSLPASALFASLRAAYPVGGHTAKTWINISTFVQRPKMTKAEVRISPMLKKRIEAVLGCEINPLDENTVANLEFMDERIFNNIKRIAEQEDQIMAERYFKFLSTPENYPYIFGFLVEVIMAGENRTEWIKKNIKN